MGADNTPQRLFGECVAENLPPNIQNHVIFDAAIDQRPAVVILGQPQIDVIEGVRKRHAQPVKPLGHLRQATRLRHGQGQMLDCSVHGRAARFMGDW